MISRSPPWKRCAVPQAISVSVQQPALLRQYVVVVPGADEIRHRSVPGPGGRPLLPIRAAGDVPDEPGGGRGRRRRDPPPLRRLTGGPALTGVVTFNRQQRAYIEGLLSDTGDDTGDQRLLDALEDPDGLFVKNLENVQGDERDVILFSTAFSANERRVLPLNFGPLNRAGGERRLNVAVTRARRQVVVFSSFDPEELRTEETSSVGLRHLRTYLEIAAKGPSVLPRDGRRRGVPDRHREEIAARLRERRLAVRTDVGLSGFALDLVLGEPSDPRVAVLLDGRAWSHRLTARDRDALPREVLSNVLGWPAVERVWLPDWLADPDAVVERLVATAAKVPPAVRPVLPSAEDVPPRRASPAAAPVSVPGGPQASEPAVFVPWVERRLGSVGILDALPDPAAAARVAAALVEVVTAEGPIHADRLARLVANAYGLNRVVEARKASILRHLPAGLRQDTVEPVMWPPSRDPAEWSEFRRTADNVDRPLEHVPLREIVNAMVAVTRASAGMTRDELHRAVLAVFGGRRLTPAATDRLDAALRLGEQLGRLTIGNGTVLAR